MSEILTYGNVLVVSRLVDAPRELVWQAWTKPEYFRKWWGPKYFTCPYSQIDLRAGGKYLHCMQSLDGRRFWSAGTFKRIVAQERLEMTDSFADERGNIVHASFYGLDKSFPREMELTVLFEDEDGKTRLTIEHEGIPSGEMTEKTAAGWDSSFDKLADWLKAKKHSEKDQSELKLS